jgi:hypothetical protein
MEGANPFHRRPEEVCVRTSAPERICVCDFATDGPILKSDQLSRNSKDLPVARSSEWGD